MLFRSAGIYSDNMATQPSPAPPRPAEPSVSQGQMGNPGTSPTITTTPPKPSSYVDYLESFSDSKYLMGQTTISRQNIRQEPSTNAAVLYTIDKGEWFVVYGESEGWFHIGRLQQNKLAGEGWAHTSYISTYWYNPKTEELTQLHAATGAQQASSPVSTDTSPSSDSVDNSSYNTSSSTSYSSFTLGSTQDQVRAAMGMPSKVTSSLNW